MTTEKDLIRMKKKGVLTDAEFLKAVRMLKSENVPATKIDTEKVHKRVLFSLVLLGVFSIFVGLGSIVAANWRYIHPVVRVFSGLIALFLSLMTSSYCQKKGKTLWMEAFLFVSFLLVGGNILLIRQNYSFNFSWERICLLWWGFSLPLLFLTKQKLIPICSVVLLGGAVWDIVINMNYMLISGLLFLLMMLTNFLSGKVAKIVRELSFIAAVFALYIGDISSGIGLGGIGVVTTTIFLIVMFTSPKTEEGFLRYCNCLFLLVSWRIFLLFWQAYHNLTNVGLTLVLFGTLLLTGAGLYTYYFKQIQTFFKRFIKHE